MPHKSGFVKPIFLNFSVDQSGHRNIQNGIHEDISTAKAASNLTPSREHFQKVLLLIECAIGSK